ncbi:hypothetical protein NUU61_003053 [Penicillium alfredii]|uniref:RNA recognition motif domain-containing protein n=1 Tax=Penicillium alfredii TaxID=1506179 RepID=A0A9W9KH53_9EURO|nr:uncharacterized protein NUU61_003053 [Penicillium alfredii]KAJ5105706.1 hypothetical protein NUU61_003053 [Penicillium alfredii]
MSNRQQIDSVIDDDDEFCEEGRCPNCRRSYDDSTIQYKIPDAEEFKADLALKHRKAAAAKKKESEKREIEASSRKNLAGVRVVQKNLVYVIGLNPTIRDENQLLQTLRGREYFGQYGDIEKIVVSKAKPGGNPNQGIGVYVTFTRKADAATCITAVDGSANGDRVLRAQYGTTKYCSSFLRNEQCNNRNCTFLHETGEDSESYSRQDLSSMNTLSSQRSSQSTPHTRSAQPITHPMRRQPSKDDSITGRQSMLDGPALPSSASWANKDAPLNRTRRGSLSGSQASQSPRPANVYVATAVEEPRRAEKPSPVSQDSQPPGQPDVPSSAAQSQSRDTRPPVSAETPFDTLLRDVTCPDFKFVFSTAAIPADEAALLNHYPSFIDPYGGVKRRAMREKLEQERVKREQELLQSAAAEEDSREAGSLQLGGEPEEVNPPRGRQTRESHGAIQPPSQQGTADNSTVGSPVSATSHQFQGLNLAGRSLTPLQQQQLMLLKSAGNQQAGLADPLSSAALDQAAQVRQGLLQSQMAQFNALQAQNRQSSRFSFANDAASKNLPNARMLSQMQSGTPNPLSAPSPQHALASGFYASSVQGPPPGLKTAGTPPISGGGMFAQGHGFTSNTNVGLGANVGKQDATPELMRELLRGRNGTNVGGLQGQEAAKREFMFPFLQQHQTPPPLTPANGLLGSFYGSQTGTLPESGGPQKQKKKGKKHRHANTSSGGGGVVDLADPSILQARMHQVGANATAGQVLYGSQGQGGYNPSMILLVNEEFPPLGVEPKERRPVDSFGFLKSQLPNDSSGRAGTPTLPPGLPLPHAHPGSSVLHEQLDSSKPSSPTPMAPPGLGPGFPRLGTPSQKQEETMSRPLSPGLSAGPTSTFGHVKDASRISLGSPESKFATKARLKSDLTVATDEKGTLVKSSDPSDRSSSGTKASPFSFKLPFSLAQSHEPSSAKPEHASSTAFAPAPGSVSAIGSRPNTPLTTASRISDSSAPRQPRILRVVETPKTETPPPIATVPSANTAAPGANKSRSGRQSVSSNSRPDTPGEFGSEAEIDVSASVSRTNSPPASSRIGSAPVRTMTKSQVKKERKQKAKEAEAKKAESAPVPKEPVQAPIIGRKRKTRKAPTSTVETLDTSAPGIPETASPTKTENASPVKAEPKPDFAKVKAKDKPTKEAKPAPVDEQPREDKASPEAWRSNNTVEQLIKDAEATGRSMKDLFLERTKPIHELLAEMHKAGELDLIKSSLFNPANLSQRTDMKCTANDYELLKQPTELTEDHRKALLRGEPVRIGTELLKNRCLITPRGCVLRHLALEEEERYLELEKNRSGTVDTLPVGDDSSNLGGGLEALFTKPEKFNICWIDDVSAQLNAASATASLDVVESVLPPNVLSAMEADSTRSHDWAVANSAEFLNTTPAAVRSFAAATAKHMLGSPGMPGGNPTLEDVAAMTNEELKALATVSQKELESTRKDLDALDKKFAGLFRRNKKLQQQALASAE